MVPECWRPRYKKQCQNEYWCTWLAYLVETSFWCIPPSTSTLLYAGDKVHGECNCSYLACIGSCRHPCCPVEHTAAVGHACSSRVHITLHQTNVNAHLHHHMAHSTQSRGPSKNSAVYRHRHHSRSMSASDQQTTQHYTMQNVSSNPLSIIYLGYASYTP